MKAADIKNGQHLLYSGSTDWEKRTSWDRGHEVEVIDSRRKWTDSAWSDPAHNVKLPDGRTIDLPGGLQESVVESRFAKVLIQNVRTLKYAVCEPRELRGDIVECRHIQALLDDVEWEKDRERQKERDAHDAIMEPLMASLSLAGIFAGRSSYETDTHYEVILDEAGVRKLTAVLERSKSWKEEGQG